MAAALFALPIDTLHLLVVDDNSPDGTGQLAEKLSSQYGNRIEVLHRPGKLGLGTAYIQGFHRALELGADVVVQMDADFSHDPARLPDMLAALEKSDVSLGSRYISGGALDRNWPLWRKALSTFGNLYARTILGLSIHDITGGFRAWKRSTLQGMPLERVRSNGYIFQVEMAFIATRLGYRFTEIPIYFAERRYGRSKMSLRIQIEAALRVWALRSMYRDLRGKRSV